MQYDHEPSHRPEFEERKVWGLGKGTIRRSHQTGQQYEEIHHGPLTTHDYSTQLTGPGSGILKGLARLVGVNIPK